MWWVATSNLAYSPNPVSHECGRSLSACVELATLTAQTQALRFVLTFTKESGWLASESLTAVHSRCNTYTLNRYCDLARFGVSIYFKFPLQLHLPCLDLEASALRPLKRTSSGTACASRHKPLVSLNPLSLKIHLRTPSPPYPLLSIDRAKHNYTHIRIPFASPHDVSCLEEKQPQLPQSPISIRTTPRHNQQEPSSDLSTSPLQSW